MFKKLKVLELSNVLAGPAVGMFFAELGAQVLKIENELTGGDITRKWKLPNEKNESISAYFSSVNFNKDYLFLNFNNSDHIKQLEGFIKESDIVITNFKDGDAEKFKLSFNDCKKINSKIIYAHIGGFKSEPQRVAFDVILQAENGYISMTGNKDEYAKMPVAMIDVLAAHQIKEGILIALIKQKQDNKAYKVSTTLEESAIVSLMNQSSNYLMANHQSSPIGTLHPNIAPYGDTISTIDNFKLILAIGTDKQFEKFCHIINLDTEIAMKYNSNSKRLKNRTELIKLIQQKTALIEAKTILKKCKDNFIPIGKIKKVGEVLESDLGKKMVLSEQINGQLTKRIKTISFNISN